MSFWKPNLSALGISEEKLPSDYGWVTLPGDSPCLPPHIPAVIRKKTRLSRCVTSLAHVSYFHANLFLAVPPKDRTLRWSPTGHADIENVTVIARAPKEWLLGPNAVSALVLVAKITHLGDTFWDQLESRTRSAAANVLIEPMPAWVEMEFDKHMTRSSREGAVTLALNYAEQESYGWRVSAQGRGGNVAFISDKSWLLHTVMPSARPSVSVVDNAIRWLLLRDLLSAAAFQYIAKPWNEAFGWPLYRE